MVDRSKKHREDLVAEARVLARHVDELADRIDGEWFQYDPDGQLARHDLIVDLNSTARGLANCATELLQRSNAEYAAVVKRGGKL